MNHAIQIKRDHAKTRRVSHNLPDRVTGTAVARRRTQVFSFACFAM